MLAWKRMDLIFARNLFTALGELDVDMGDYKIPYVFDVKSAAINIHARNKSNPRIPETVMTLYIDWMTGEVTIDNRIADQVNGLVEVPSVEAIKFWDGIVATILTKDGIKFTKWFRERYVS